MELIAVLENPNYIINIGHVIRNVNGLGLDRLYVVDQLRRLDDDPDALRNRKTLLKHSSGAVQFTSVRRFDSTQQCLQVLAAEGFVSVGTTPHVNEKTCLLHESNLTAPKLALWFGDEAGGLTDEALAHCQFNVVVDMRGQVESLNLATSTGIVFYEALRQRRQK